MGKARKIPVTSSTQTARSLRLRGHAQQFHGDGRNSELMPPRGVCGVVDDIRSEHCAHHSCELGSILYTSAQGILILIDLAMIIVFVKLLHVHSSPVVARTERRSGTGAARHHLSVT